MSIERSYEKEIMSRCFLFLLALIAYSATLAKEGHPLIAEYPGAKLRKSEIRQFIGYDVLVGFDGDNPLQEYVEGKRTKLNFMLPRDRSEQEVVANYKQALSKAGFETVYQCSMAACIRPKRMNELVGPLYANGQNIEFVTLKKNTDKGRVFVIVYISGYDGEHLGSFIIVEEMPMETGLVNINEVDDQLFTTVEVESSQSKDTRNSSDHPLITRFPGSYIKRYSQRDFTEVKLVTGISDDKTKTNSETVSGKQTLIKYDLPRNRSEIEVMQNYLQALQKANFDVVFKCTQSECGEIKAFEKSMINDGMYGHLFHSYILGKKSFANGDVYIAVYQRGYKQESMAQVHVLETKSMQLDQVTVSVDMLTESIENTGHISLYGIYFESDKAEIKEKSQPTLKTMAEYLNKNSQLKFYVVGHTDDQGTELYNQQLSDRRAASVKRVLTEQFKVSADQLKSHGAGEWSPIANNKSESGRAINRRVELVLRSHD